MLKNYGKWSIVTGASSGIGKAFAYDLARKGIDLILISNQEAELKKVCENLTKEFGIFALNCCIDLADANSIEAIKKVAEGKEIGVLINDASYGIHGKFSDTPVNDYMHMINVNVHAYVALTHAFLPQMVSRRKGAVIMVSSLNAFSPIAESSVYTATKAFELYFGGALWHELKQDNIDVLVVMPGPTITGFQEKAGTKVNSMAITPETLVSGVWPCLGNKVTYIPGMQNKLLSFIGSNIDLEKRIVLASKIYKLMLHEKPESDLLHLFAELDFL